MMWIGEVLSRCGRSKCLIAKWHFLIANSYLSINNDTTALPPPAASPEEDEDALQNWPWIESPIRMDYGYNLK